MPGGPHAHELRQRGGPPSLLSAAQWASPAQSHPSGATAPHTAASQAIVQDQRRRRRRQRAEASLGLGLVLSAGQAERSAPARGSVGRAGGRFLSPSRLRAVASLSSVALYAFYVASMLVAPRVRPQRWARELRPGAWAGVAPWPPARVTEREALSGPRAAWEHAASTPYVIGGAWAGGKGNSTRVVRYAVARVYLRGWAPVSDALACSPGGDGGGGPRESPYTQEEFLAAATSGGPRGGGSAAVGATAMRSNDPGACAGGGGELRSPICHCALEAYVSHAADAASAIEEAVASVERSGVADAEAASSAVAAAARAVEASRVESLVPALRVCAASTAPTYSTLPAPWAACAGLCPFVGLAAALAVSCLTSMPHLAVWGVSESLWSPAQAAAGLLAGVASCASLFGVFCASVSGAGSSWLQALLMAILMVLGVAVRATSELFSSQGVDAGAPKGRGWRRWSEAIAGARGGVTARPGGWFGWMGLSAMGWLLANRDVVGGPWGDGASPPAPDGSQASPTPPPPVVPDRFWEGYIAQLPTLSVVVDTMSHRRSAWLLSGGVVSSTCIALLGASLSRCNELCMALSTIGPRVRASSTVAGPGATLDPLVEMPPKYQGDVMRVVSMVSSRSMAMAFGASVAIWSVMQGKATIRYLSDTPGLLERPTQERVWMESLYMAYALLPLLDAPGIHILLVTASYSTAGAGGEDTNGWRAGARALRTVAMDRELMGAVRMVAERAIHVCMVWTMLQASRVFG